MRTRSALTWSSLGVFLIAGAGVALAYSRGQFPGRPVDGQVVALVGARIYDPAGDSTIDPATVIIRGREIVAVGEYEPVPDDAYILYVNGLTLLPGLIDSHVHLSGIRSRISDGSRELGWLPYLWKFVRRFPDRRRDLIEAGVTTAKSLGDPHPWVMRLADRIERHELAGPRVFAAGPMFTAPGGHPVARFRQAGQGDTSFIAQVTRQLAGPAEAQIAVNRISRSVSFVSVVLERREPDLPRMAPSVLYMVTAAAHEHGLPVFAHVSSLEDLALALAAGADGIEHLPFDQPIDSLTLAELRERRTFVDPTLHAIEQHVGEFMGDTAGARRARGNLRRLVQAGVRLLAGSDAPSPGTDFGYTLHEELRNLVEAGYTPGEAIAAATSVAAECLGLSDRLGSIAPGKWADIIAVGGEPLEDIRAVANIYLVIADGQVLLDRLDQVRRPGTIVLGRTAPRAQAAP
jgi:enamidase